MNRSSLYLLAWVGLAFTFVTSCTFITNADRIDGVRISPEVALPLLNTSVSFEELLNNYEGEGSISTNQAGVYVYSIERRFSAQNSETLVPLGRIGSPILLPTTRFPLEYSFIGKVSIANIKSGFFLYDADQTVAGTYRLTLTIPELTLNGQSLLVDRTDSYPGPISGSVDLTGYQVDVSADSLTIQYTFTDVGTSLPVVPTLLQASVENALFSYLQGPELNAVLPTISDSTEISLFPDELQGSVFFADPSLTVRFRNSFGLPITINLAEVTVNPGTNDELTLTANLINQEQLLNYPTLRQVGEFAVTEFVFDKDNSNLPELLSTFPQEIRQRLGARIAYTAGPTDPEIFVTDSSRVELDFLVDIPLDVSVNAFTFSQTGDFDLGIETGESGIDTEAEFKLLTENGIPLTLDMQVYFLDAQAAVIDSLFDENARLFEAAPIGADGTANGVTSNELFITVAGDRLDRLTNATQFEIQTRFTTTGAPAQTVKLRSTDQVGLKLGVKTSVTVE